jgi:hypothetical protein
MLAQNKVPCTLNLKSVGGLRICLPYKALLGNNNLSENKVSLGHYINLVPPLNPRLLSTLYKSVKYSNRESFQGRNPE